MNLTEIKNNTYIKQVESHTPKLMQQFLIRRMGKVGNPSDTSHTRDRKVDRI